MPRHTNQPRCPDCAMHLARCVCATLPRVELPWRLLVLQHHRERKKPSNTARVLVRAVTNSALRAVAARGQPWSPEYLEPIVAGDGSGRVTGSPATVEQRVVLFPSARARVVTRADLAEWAARPTCLIVVDGSWRQASRLANRTEGIVDLPHVMLPPGPPSRWSVRTAPRPDQLCTFEAVVRLVALQPELPAAHALELAFQQVLAAQQIAKPPLRTRQGSGPG